MKKLFLLLALLGIVATGCSKDEVDKGNDNKTEQPNENEGGNENDDNEKPVFEIDAEGSYTIPAEGAEIKVTITTNLEYRVEVSEDAKAWLSIGDTRAVRTETLIFTVAKNESDRERTATITIFNKDDEKVFEFRLTQKFNNKEDIPGNIFFGLDKERVTISPDGGSVDVIVYSNYKWEISGVSDWCTPSVNGGDADEDGQKVTFSADVAYDDRETTFWFRCADEKIKFVVSQKSNNAIIYYTSSNGEIVQPNESSAFGATILSNKYIDGVGVIEFDAPITTIGEEAFYDCDSLTSVTIPDSVTTIGDYAFELCSSLTSVTISDSITTIGESAFQGCSSLTSVTIPDSVTTMGDYAFWGCKTLTSVTIGDSVTTMGDYAFYYCESLTSVTIGDSLTTIGYAAFYRCGSLTSITIPDNVTTIGDYAFWYCSSLTSVYCKAITPPVGYDEMFNYGPSGRTIYVPKESVNKYISAQGWSRYKSFIVGYNF